MVANDDNEDGDSKDQNKDQKQQQSNEKDNREDEEIIHDLDKEPNPNEQVNKLFETSS